MNADPEVISLLIEAPDSQLDMSIKPLIQKWSNPPAAIQILEVIDKCIFEALASTFVMVIFDGMYEDALKRESITHESLVPLATWRKR